MHRVKSLIPMGEIESGAVAQLTHLLTYPFVEHIAVLPDVHQGYFAPIGTAVLTRGVISPEMVGVDVSCAGCAAKLDTRADDLNEQELQHIMHSLLKVIPVGRGEHQAPQDYPVFKSVFPAFSKEISKRITDKMRVQAGSLGGGNHCLELAGDDSGDLWVVVHSGSRGPGNMFAHEWFRLTKEHDTHLPEKFLNFGSEAGRAYREDIKAIDVFAQVNRQEMVLRVCEVLGASVVEMHEANHNHLEYFGEGRVIHRKGAMHLPAGKIGVVLGNMRDGSFLVEGLGSETYLDTVSHGAGRRMSRGQAKEKISYDTLVEQMAGVVSNLTEKTIDEAPEAYKDCNNVIYVQEGVNLRVLTKLTPVLNIEG